MRWIALVALLIPLSASAAEPEWSLHLQDFSPWSKDSGIFIKSDGTIGLSTGYREEGKKVCPSISLDDGERYSYADLIAAIPEAIPDRSTLHFPTRCSDADENYLTVDSGTTSRSFRYAQDKECLNNTVIPAWLTQIVEALWTKYEQVKDCLPEP